MIDTVENQISKRTERLSARWRAAQPSKARYFWALFIPLFLAITLLLSSLLIGEYLRSSSLIKSNEALYLNVLKQTLISDLEEIGPDLRVLMMHQSLQNYLRDPTEQNQRGLEHLFSVLALHKRYYDQIRLLDAQGKEKVRVDFRKDKAQAIPLNQLQDKSDRYYFKESLSLEKGDIFVSPLDLNVENGQVETPHKPIIRFATPIFNERNVRVGVLIVNYLAERMLNHFDEMSHGSAGHIELINPDGYWIRSHMSGRNWGFMFDQKERFSDTYPALWYDIQRKITGSFSNSDELITYTSVAPVETVAESIQLIPEFAHVANQPNKHPWKIISIVPRKVITDRLIGMMVNINGPVWLILILVLTVGSWRFAVNRVTREQLKIESDLHAKVFAWTTEGVTITDAHANIVDVNNGFTRITGYSREEVLGKNPSILSSGRHDPDYYSRMWSDIRRKGFWEGEIYNQRKDGVIYCEWIRIAAAFDQNKRVQNYIALISDITQRKAIEQNLIRQAHEDPLTHLANRLAIEEFLHTEIARSRRTGDKVACIYIDLNDFKIINDTYGHHVGDQVLKEVSRRLTIHAREMDKVSRLGGDEFAIVLTDLDSVLQVHQVAQRIISSMGEKIITNWEEFSVGLSLGIAIFPDDADDGQSLMRHADKAMYNNKRESKGL